MPKTAVKKLAPVVEERAPPPRVVEPPKTKPQAPAPKAKVEPPKQKAEVQKPVPKIEPPKPVSRAEPPSKKAPPPVKAPPVVVAEIFKEYPYCGPGVKDKADPIILRGM